VAETLEDRNDTGTLTMEYPYTVCFPSLLEFRIKVSISLVIKGFMMSLKGPVRDHTFVFADCFMMRFEIRQNASAFHTRVGVKR